MSTSRPYIASSAEWFKCYTTKTCGFLGDTCMNVLRNHLYVIVCKSRKTQFISFVLLFDLWVVVLVLFKHVKVRDQ